MKPRKNSESKKREKSLEISRFPPFGFPNGCFPRVDRILTTQHGRGRRIRTRDPRFWRPVLYQLSYTPIVDFVNTSYYITLFVGLQDFFEKKFLSSKKSLFGRFFRCGWFAVSAFWGALHGCFRLVSLDRRRCARLQRKRGEPVGAVTEGSAAQSAVGARSRGFSVILSQNPFR